MNSIIKLIIISLLFNQFLTAQSNYILKPNGRITPQNKIISKANALNKIKGGNIDKINATLDTLSYSRLGGTFNANFGLNSQDIIVQYFYAPADMVITAIGFSCSDDGGAFNGSDISIRLIKLNWEWETFDSITDDIYLGYYPQNDSLGKVDYFGENASGNWIDSSNGLYPLPPWSNSSDPALNTYEYDIWSDSGKGVNVTPVKQNSAGEYQFVNTHDLGFNPQIRRKEIIGVVVKHNGTTFENDRIGFHASTDAGIPGLKFYANGRNDSTDFGWWIRQFTFDFALAVDLIGGPHYHFSFVTELYTTVSTESRIVEAEIVGDGPNFNVFNEINLYYTTDEQNYNKIQMDSIGLNRYSGEIPGQAPGTTINYYCEAVDYEGYKWDSQSFTYYIFEPTKDVNTLLIFNGLPESGYPSSYYFGNDDFDGYEPINFPHDIWAYDRIDSTLINNYKNIFEITTSGPNFYHKDLIRDWLNEDGNRNYFLAGDEWLGVENGFIDSTFSPGTFEYDILGISRSYNDVSFDGTSGQNLTSKLVPIENSLLGGELYNLFMANGSTDSLVYDPLNENSIHNWIDAFEVVESENIELTVETRAIEGEPNVLIKPCALHNITPNGNKIVFLSFDPISINSAPDYYWYGFSKTSLQVQTLNWFGITTDINDEILGESIPNKFSVSQNYPNPFNPSTTIKYSIPLVETGYTSYLQIIIYDILGRKVKTLVDQKHSPGNYQVIFDASDFNSGVYFYQLKAGDFVQTRKMLLLK